jgi:hypothetical protein
MPLHRFGRYALGISYRPDAFTSFLAVCFGNFLPPNCLYAVFGGMLWEFLTAQLPLRCFGRYALGISYRPIVSTLFLAVCFLDFLPPGWLYTVLGGKIHKNNTA